MRARTVAALLLTFAVGMVTGWLLQPDARVTSHLPSKSDAGGARRPIKKAGVSSKTVADWVKRIETEGALEIVDEVPTPELEPLLNSLVGSIWGALGQDEASRLEVLIGTWSRRDLEGALAWARSLDHPRKREIALMCVASALAEDSPQRSFDIFAEIGEMTLRYRPAALNTMMRTVYQEAAASGGEALLDLVKRTPLNQTGTTVGVSITYPEGFDFGAFVDGLSELTLGRSDPPRAFELRNPLGEWAKIDPDAAFGYVLDRVASGEYVRWSSLASEVKQQWGAEEGDRWVGAQLAAQPPELQLALLRDTDLTHSPGILRRYIANMPSEESAAAFRQRAITYAGETIGRPLGIFQILNDIPSVEARVQTITSMRGVKDPAGIRYQLRQWGVAEERIEQVVAIVQSEEEGLDANSP